MTTYSPSTKSSTSHSTRTSKGKGLAIKLEKKRFSVIQICKVITTLAVVGFFFLSYYLITEQRTQAEMAKDYITTLENRNQTCFNKWADLEERGRIIQTIEFTEDLVEDLVKEE